MCVCLCACAVYTLYKSILPVHRGDSIIVQKGPLIGSAWLDNKVVTVLSTTSQPVATGTVLRRQKDGRRTPVLCPDSIIAYNQHMGGVDRGDQLRGYYSCRSKSRKFYKYIFYFLLDVAITNAFVLYKHYHHQPAKCLLAVKDFRVLLAKQLIGSYSSRRTPGRKGEISRRLPITHFPFNENRQHPTRKRGRCAFCTKRSKRTDSSWKCKECDVWLCHSGDTNTDCFYLWHTDL